MFLRIHTEDVWLVPLIKFYMKDLFGLNPYQFFLLFCTNKKIKYVHHGTKFYDKYINTDDRINIDDDGSSIFPYQKERNIYNTKYKETYGNRRYLFPYQI